MSHLQYFSYPGFGDTAKADSHYSQAVRIGDTIEISGQGGWDPDTGKLREGVEAQIDQSFDNVELALQTAGGKGWSQVYKVRCYFSASHLTEDTWARTVANLRRRLPNHRPLLTVVEVKSLYAGMPLEIEVAAHLGS